jgi:hypothetical protein
MPLQQAFSVARAHVTSQQLWVLKTSNLPNQAFSIEAVSTQHVTVVGPQPLNVLVQLQLNGLCQKQLTPFTASPYP